MSLTASVFILLALTTGNLVVQDFAGPNLYTARAGQLRARAITGNTENTYDIFSGKDPLSSLRSSSGNTLSENAEFFLKKGSNTVYTFLRNETLFETPSYSETEYIFRDQSIITKYEKDLLRIGWVGAGMTKDQLYDIPRQLRVSKPEETLNDYFNFITWVYIEKRDPNLWKEIQEIEGNEARWAFLINSQKKFQFLDKKGYFRTFFLSLMERNLSKFNVNDINQNRNNETQTITYLRNFNSQEIQDGINRIRKPKIDPVEDDYSKTFSETLSQEYLNFLISFPQNEIINLWVKNSAGNNKDIPNEISEWNTITLQEKKVFINENQIFFKMLLQKMK